MKKNNFHFNLYKAYKAWEDTVKNDKAYKNYAKSLSNQNNGKSALKGMIGKKNIDLAWVKRIEENLPYIDNAIRESRSFIEQKDEIVNIEKVKRVNIQSIRHLAQNTNLIAKVEDNGEVLPSKILNIYYESNLAIYENRFLFTLLYRLSEFIEKRYHALIDKDEKIEIDYQINKKVRRKQKTSQINLEVAFTAEADTKKVNSKSDVNNLSGFARIVRIRNIVQDFFSLPLIRDLQGIQEVRSPIIRTNLMSKNTNFRNCLELWEYIERYKSEGYTYQNKTFQGAMPQAIEADLNNIAIFGNFLTEITFNAEHNKTLKKEYNLFKRKQILMEKQEKLEIKTLAKTEEKQIFNKKLEARKKSYETKLEKINQRLLVLKEKNKEKQQKLEEKLKKTINNLKTRNQNYREKNKKLQERLKELRAKNKKLNNKTASIKKINDEITDNKITDNKKTDNKKLDIKKSNTQKPSVKPKQKVAETTLNKTTKTNKKVVKDNKGENIAKKTNEKTVKSNIDKGKTNKTSEKTVKVNSNKVKADNASEKVVKENQNKNKANKASQK